MTSKEKIEKMRWINFIAGVLIFVNLAMNSRDIIYESLGSRANMDDYIIYAVFYLLPAILVSILGLFKKYWGSFIFSFYFIAWSMFMYSERIGNPVINAITLIIPCLALFFTPFLRIVFNKEEIDKDSPSKEEITS